MQFTVIFYSKIAIFDPSPEKFRACGALFWGRCAPGPAAPDPPSIEHPRQPLHLVAIPGGEHARAGGQGGGGANRARIA